MAKISKFKQIFDPKMWLYDFVKITGGLPALIDQRIKTIFLNEKKAKGWYKGKFIVCSNHRSVWDPLILTNLFWKRRILFVATKEIFKRKGANRFFNRVGLIKVNRDDVSVETFQKVKSVLDRGHLVGVFPESHIKDQDEIRTFAPGIVMMAAICDAPILPIYIVKRKKRTQRQVVIIGEKIDYKNYTKGGYPTMQQIQKITTILQQEENKLKDKYIEWQEKRKK